MSNSNPQVSAFTFRYPNLTNILYTQIFIAEAFDPNTQPEPNLNEYKCIWDTGATISVITSKVITDLKLQPIGKELCYNAGGQNMQNTYLVAIKLPNGVGSPSVKVIDGKVQDFDVLIGMDIIRAGDFAVTSEDGKTVMSYQFPSVGPIDFVKQINKIKPTSSSEQKRRARNKKKKDRQKSKKK